MSEAEAINAFTVDVEDWFQVGALERVVSRDDWPNMESRVEANTIRLLDLLDEFEVHGTFFVLGWIAQHKPGLVQEIAARGHEVACHGLSHRAVYTQTPEEFREETRVSRSILQDLSGQPVAGYRAASFSITRDSLWALDILIEAGFEYDSSIFPIRHDRYGIPHAPRKPFIIKGKMGELLEVPMAAVGEGLFRLPVSGGGYFRLLPYWLTRAGLRHLNEQGRPFPFYMHPWEVDPGQPRMSEASALSKFRHYRNLDRTEGRLRRMLGEFRFGRMDAWVKQARSHAAELESGELARAA
jgi:polysaccharide deacetylase family protein (PEP-CTERM system associated)